jgi:hypothetical protein
MGEQTAELAEDRYAISTTAREHEADARQKGRLSAASSGNFQDDCRRCTCMPCRPLLAKLSTCDRIIAWGAAPFRALHEFISYTGLRLSPMSTSTCVMYVRFHLMCGTIKCTQIYTKVTFTIYNFDLSTPCTGSVERASIQFATSFMNTSFSGEGSS